MTNRTVMILSFVAAALFAVAGIFSLVGGSAGTGALYIVAGALFAVVGLIRLRGGGPGGGRGRGGGAGRH
ncbi:hypothetical protein [Microbacterium oleivorans]|uniref:Uncharacterized protein n=1 Tax=Microbacterium oleivorans TaxID=273677 RepID=A0A7D5IR47_9MICO|nr:hypothetical protein [Microbacterium oleivorans]QLD12301.1 hypothetical protein HW566_11260 [Microbacterium oleivorans]